MSVIVQVVLRGLSPDQYDAVRAETGWLERRPEGGNGHLTWFQGDDCFNVDAWESPEHFQRFAEQRLGPAMARVGASQQPEFSIHAAHEVYLPEAMTRLATPAMLIARSLPPTER